MYSKVVGFVLFSLLFLAESSWSQIQIHGIIKDSLADEPVPYASIHIKGESQGTIASVDGKFTLFAQAPSINATVQVVGYKTKDVTLTAQQQPIVVYLQSQSRTLDEVVILKHKKKYEKKGNPAIEFINKVRLHMRDQDPFEQPFYSYDKYEQMTFGLNDLGNIDKNIIMKTFKGAWEYLDTSEVSHKVILPVSLNETYSTDYYRRKPHSHKSLVIGAQHVGLDENFDPSSIKNFMDDAFREIDIYTNDIKFMQNRFISPLSSMGPNFYKYYLNDTIEIDGERCIELDFLPFNTESFGFVGRMYFLLNDTSMFLKKLSMNVPRNINLNYVERIYVEQEFKKAENGSRLKTLDDMMVEFKVLKNTQGLFARRKTAYTNFNFNALVSTKVFEQTGEKEVAPGALTRNETFWKKHRLFHIKHDDKRMHDMMKRLRSSRLFYWGEQAFTLLYNGYVPTGKPSKFDFGPLNTMFSGNELEGFRMRMGGMSTAHLSKHWFNRWYVAYGFKDKKLKYHGELEYSFPEKVYHGNEFPIHSVKVTHEYDIDKVGQHYLYTSQDNAFLLLKRQKDDKINYLRTTRLDYELELKNGFSLAVGFEHNVHEASRLLPFIDGYGKTSSRYQLAGFNLTLRYAPGEKFYQTRSYRFPINIDNPIITLSHTFQPKGFLGSDFEVNKTELGIQKRFWFSAWGYTDAMITGAKIWSQVPYPNLLIPNANLSYTIQPEGYALMNAMEFANDQYVSCEVTYWMNGAIMNYIPLLKKLKLREVLSFRGLLGSLSNKNNPYKNKDLFQFPENTRCEPMGKKPYMELGVGLDNIFSFLRLDYVWRLSYRDTPGVDKSGVRMQIHISF